MKDAMIRILFFVLMISVGGCTTMQSPTRMDIAEVVKGLDHESHWEDMKVFREDPALAARLLVDELHPISETHIVNWKQEQRSKDLHVIWCIRGLRYLTSIEFYGRTKHQFDLENDIEDTRQQFLTDGRDSNLLRNHEVKFFGVWPSRDSVYIAPLDAQLKIIAQWRSWVKSDLPQFNFPPERFDYFEMYV